MTVERREEEEDPSQQSTDATAVWPFLRFDSPPRKIYHFFQQFRNRVENPSNYNNFLKGVKWSPDGTCFLTSCDDNTIRLFHLPEEASYIDQLASDYQDSYHSNLVINEAEMVYDYCWYPYMCSSDPTSSVFVATTRDHPIHLWDATSGQLRCTYRAYNDMDEITAALSVSFNSSGTKLFAGYNKMLRVFDVHRPGRDFQQFSLHKGKDGPSGIVSSIAVSPSHSGMLALGSYNQSTALYAEDNMELLYVLHGQSGGITQVLFSKDGNYLYTGGRKDSYILCWDVRNTVDIVYKLYRSTENTNQRVSFDIEPCGRHLGAGGEDGLVHIYDLQSGQWITAFQAASDTVNGFGFHPHLPLAASSSGNRRFSLPDNFEENWNLRGDENCASIWTFG
ncbi:Guanine nucleotide-binding protein [Dioscorea alata]|uniref:Guanine nucleotide-binding protein n=2 Tax=Dioscorea alata TaxID=55571 RepID=A0ACB7TQD8_DIOAL|nr:Guanine nucleotide-binding protein [Dioscorea alata]KAH7650728.1 Guanine nucleotide-binding protein [Dioscorea alata]